MKKKYKYEFLVTMNYLNINYGFSILDFKMYRPNLLTNNSVFNRHQKAYRDYEVVFPKIIIKMKKNIKNKKEVQE